AVTARTGPLQCEKPLGMPNLALAAAHRTNSWFGAGLGAASRADLTRDGCGYVDLSGFAGERLFERQLHIIPHVGAALTAGTAAAPAAAHAEEIIENVSQR